jgi:hypothetical protein
MTCDLMATDPAGDQAVVCSCLAWSAERGLHNRKSDPCAMTTDSSAT